ncbi:methyl-accepting chemotaxis protein/sensory box protein [Nautilia profundicola AmH]|uniref:Methyl-accepting chemotaxis protein/sensory box protein n=1 Tax=Nautilia profundicola (strain ATCC BAA-1463 / DSM 18972 / AmH) TaxID=598659 RepID=B9L5M6_NAUPA|nr:PAS sensor domain-containing protein [Nautilia profundicola]ACM92154.1 methyl-accepting chemotaxis protein/sensory box protein [Nautilia profundicola AmH]
MRPNPIDEEVTFEDAGVANRSIISKTDLKGIITFVNKPFCTLSGYSKEELIGKPHNIIRHPDMPKSIFKQMWNTIEKGETFRGFIKNLRKDGKYYWVEAFIEPIYDENGVKIGYSSIRKPVSDSDKEKYEKLYKELKEKEE